MQARGDAVFLAGCEDVIHRFLGGLGAGRLVVLRTHALGQIVRAHEDRVDAGDRENLVGVLDRLDMLALQDNEQFFIDVGVVIAGGRAKVERMNAAADTAVAIGRIKHGGDGVLGFLPAVDHRHDNALSAIVENAFDMVVAIRRHASQRGAASVGDRGEHVGRGLPIDEAVLHIDGQPVKPRSGHETARRDTAERQPRADRRLAGFE